MILKTERLLIRPINQADLLSYHELLSNPENFEFEISEPFSLEQTEAEILNIEERNKEFNSAIGTSTFGIELVDGRKLIGVIYGAYIDLDSEFLELGIIIDHVFTRQGYASEALNMYIDFAFSNTDLHKIFARTDGRNLACIRLLEKVNMKQEGLLRKCKKCGW